MYLNYLKRSSVVLLAALAVSSLPALTPLVRAAEKEDQSVDMDDEAGKDGDASTSKRVSDRGYLGVSVQRLRHSLKQAFDIPEDVEGLLISKVYDGSPADKAGLRDKDVVVRFNGQKVDDEDAFTRAIRESRPGSQATIQVWRDGRTVDLSATLGNVRRDARRSWSWSDESDSDDDVGVPPTPPVAPRPPVFAFSNDDHGHMGVYLQDLNKDIAGYFSAPDDRGALIWQVVDDSPAQAAGLKAGDVVTAVEGKPVRDSQDLREILADYEAGEMVAVTYLRHGQSGTAKVKLDQGEGADYMFGSMKALEGLRRMRPGRDMQMFKGRRDQTPSRSMERLKQEMERLQERMNQLKEDLERLKD